MNTQTTEQVNVKELHLNDLNGLIGKKIAWFAPAYSHNHPYEGVAIITDVNMSNRRPLTVDTISGDNLKHAFVDDLANDGTLAYSDSFRTVTYIIL